MKYYNNKNYMTYFYILVIYFISFFRCNATEIPNDIFIKKIGFPNNKEIVIIHDYGWSTYSVNTNKPKQTVSFKEQQIIEDFSFNGKDTLAIITKKNLLVYYIKSGNLLFYKDFLHSTSHRIAFHSFANFLIHLDIEQKKFNVYQEYNTLHSLECKVRTISDLAINPLNNDVCILNCNNPQSYSNMWRFQHGMSILEHNIFTIKSVKYFNGSEEAIYLSPTVGSNNIKKTIIDSYLLGSFCEYNPNGTVLVINFYHKYVFYHTDNYKPYLTLNHPHTTYNSITFHPNKVIFGIINIHKNAIEIWSYLEKTETPLATIPLISEKKSKSESSHFDTHKRIAFSPDGNKIVAIDNNCKEYHIVPTPQCAFYDQDTLSKCTFLYFYLKHLLPFDIIRIIINKFAQLPNLHVIKQKFNKKKEKNNNECIIS